MSEPSNARSGAATPPEEGSDALPAGTRLAEFEIRQVIGIGGFGIVYRAWDEALERDWRSRNTCRSRWPAAPRGAA